MAISEKSIVSDTDTQYRALPPGSIIGILGGGQLGSMLALSAARLGFQCYIFDPNADCPAARNAARHMQAEYMDLDRVKEFANVCDVVTYEFENVPAKTAFSASQHSTLFPTSLALDVAQDRLQEKTFIRDRANVAVADFIDIQSEAGLIEATQTLGFPCVLKTRRLGYDGKGQTILRKPDDIHSAWENLKGVDAILEAFIPFIREISVVTGRNIWGQSASYPLIENIHKDHILHTSTAPAARDDGRAQALSKKIMDALNYVGVMATEFFELEDGTLIVNEIAPRVHNSGHWTQNAGCIDQFELHIRAICGWPLGSTVPTHTVEMTNLLGQDIDNWQDYADETGTFIHLYGKSEPRQGRKMGHINRIIKTTP